MTDAERSLEDRRRDTLDRLANEVDAWVASADGERALPYLVPLSFLWEHGSMLIATPTASPTGRNLAATGVARVGVGLTRDVILIEGSVTWEEAGEVDSGLADAFAAKAGFDPRVSSAPYRYFRIHPRRVQAWREENELAGRDITGDGRWLVPSAGA